MTPKRCPFHYRGLECKSRKSRNTWNNRQIWPWSTELSRAKANRVLPRECTGPRKHPFPSTQEKTLHMNITRWLSLKSDWLYSLQPNMEKLYTVNRSLSHVQLFVSPWTAACQASLSITNSQSLLKSCPLSQWCHPIISSSVIPFSSHFQYFPASWSFEMSQIFTSGGQIIGVSASASALVMNIQDWFSWGLTSLISL